MNRKNTAFMAGAALAILAAGTAVTANSYAAGSTSKDSRTDGLAAKIATVFNLDQTKVKETITAYQTEERANREAEMQRTISEKLTQAVTDGKITTEQKTTLETKMAELKIKRDAAMTLTNDAARKTAMNALRDETKAFVDANSWAKDLLPGPGGRGDKGGRGGHRGGMIRSTPKGDAPAAN
jgi:hypothetical protein